jgi:DNA-directed RNA polymerase subunit H (RpoH/RPB5)
MSIITNTIPFRIPIFPFSKTVALLSFSILLNLIVVFGQVYSAQLDTSTYLRLREGMSEGEILTRAGIPDKEIYFDSEAQRTLESIKQLLYIPGPLESDPHLTVITIQKGKVIKIERTKIFSPPSRSIGGQINSSIYNRLRIGMSEGELLTIAGLPDKEVYLGTELEGIGTSIRQLLYIPGPTDSDPHLTVISIQEGRIIRIERTKIISR